MSTLKPHTGPRARLVARLLQASKRGYGPHLCCPLHTTKMALVLFLLLLLVGSAAGAVGGMPAMPNEFPWAAHVYIDGGGECGGSLIATDWVLTVRNLFDVCFLKID